MEKDKDKVTEDYFASALDVFAQLKRMERMLVYLCQKVNPVVREVSDISDILPPKRKKLGE